MIVISDTSPINYLILIGEIHILQELFGRVVIPHAVYSELQHPKTPQVVKDWIVNTSSWIEVKHADASSFSPSRQIGDGEREAIALALELMADAVLIDDRDGISEARSQRLITLGTLSLLERAADKNLVNLSEAIDSLNQTSFRFPPHEIVDAMLERDRKRRAKS